MAIRVLATSGLVLALLASSAGLEQQAPAVFNPQHGTLARDETQAIYAPDRTDPWNQVFYLLFTRTLEARLVEPYHSRSGRLITFAFHTDPLQPKPRVERLKPSDNAHAQDVARRKMAREYFRALQLEWNR
jgi:hypothetical protein